VLLAITTNLSRCKPNGRIEARRRRGLRCSRLIAGVALCLVLLTAVADASSTRLETRSGDPAAALSHTPAGVINAWWRALADRDWALMCSLQSAQAQSEWIDHSRPSTPQTCVGAVALMWGRKFMAPYLRIAQGTRAYHVLVHGRLAIGETAYLYHGKLVPTNDASTNDYLIEIGNRWYLDAKDCHLPYPPSGCVK
jgi:hypothetical protein